MRISTPFSRVKFFLGSLPAEDRAFWLGLIAFGLGLILLARAPTLPTPIRIGLLVETTLYAGTIIGSLGYCVANWRYAWREALDADRGPGG
jgi:hypothetical protein